MASDDAGAGVDQDGVVKAELATAGRDLCDLGIGMSTGIVREGNEPINGPDFDSGAALLRLRLKCDLSSG